MGAAESSPRRLTIPNENQFIQITDNLAERLLACQQKKEKTAEEKARDKRREAECPPSEAAKSVSDYENIPPDRMKCKCIYIIIQWFNRLPLLDYLYTLTEGRWQWIFKKFVHSCNIFQSHWYMRPICYKICFIKYKHTCLYIVLVIYRFVNFSVMNRADLQIKSFIRWLTNIYAYQK